MKTFIIHTLHQKSIQYANSCLDSFKYYTGWEPEMFLGVTIDSLPEWEKKYPLKIKKKSRAKLFEKEGKNNKQNHKRFLTKKSCSYNHYRLFHMCIELGQPIAVVEHDSHCKNNWVNQPFEDVLLMNISSAVARHPDPKVRKANKNVKYGIQNLNLTHMNYRHDPEIKHGIMIPGTAAYAITPRGAKKMINVYEHIGWEQSDFIINTAYVTIQTIIPELFTFKLPNLATSHGENMK